jgi:hypothetical protein
LAASFILPPLALAVTVLPGQGVSISQVSFNWPSNPFPDSPTGVIEVDHATLVAATGMASGYINVAVPSGWIVQNLPIFSGSPYPSISTAFDLGSSGAISSIPLLVDYSPTPLTFFSGPPAAAFSVGPTTFSGQGKDAGPFVGPPAPMPVAVIQFVAGGAFTLCCQPGHPNIEAADNQCGPAACANSLCWLKATYGMTLPDQCGMGLGNDGSVVGKLDGTMTRGFTTRRSGSALSDANFLKGKLTYLSNNNLGLTVDFMGTLDGDPPPGNFTAAGRVGTRKPGNPSAGWILSEICNGEDVELGYTNPKPPGGGHWVQVLCAGTILGKPFIVHSSDQDQTSDTKGTGGPPQFAWLQDTDADGTLNLVGEPNTPNADIVVAESPGQPVRTTRSTWGAVKAHYR